MRRMILAMALVAGLATSAAAQTPATPGQAFGFDYLTADLATYAVIRFEQAIDGAAWVDVGIPTVANDAQTPAGATTYRVAIPALTPGAHTVTWRACNATACSAAATPLAFTLVVQPPTVSGGRIVSVGQ